MILGVSGTVKHGLSHGMEWTEMGQALGGMNVRRRYVDWRCGSGL